MDIKRETLDIRSWTKHLFLGISSTDIDTLVPPLYQCVIEEFWLLFQPLPHLVGHYLRLPNIIEGISNPSCELLYWTNTSHCKQEIFICYYPLNRVHLPKKKKKKKKRRIRERYLGSRTHHMQGILT
jgi:hypothetical protein